MYTSGCCIGCLFPGGVFCSSNSHFSCISFQSFGYICLNVSIKDYSFTSEPRASKTDRIFFFLCLMNDPTPMPPLSGCSIYLLDLYPIYLRVLIPSISGFLSGLVRVALRSYQPAYQASSYQQSHSLSKPVPFYKQSAFNVAPQCTCNRCTFTALMHMQPMYMYHPNACATDIALSV